ncbi:DUF1573 domain-containing protein, partial [bacterium]
MWWGRSRQASVLSGNQNNPKGSLVSDATIHDFGTISMKNGNVSKVFKISNPTSQDIKLKSIATSCMCTTAYMLQGSERMGPYGMEGMGGMTQMDEVIKGGESKDIEVVYDPNAHGPAGVGAVDRYVDIKDASGGVLRLEIKASVT